MRIPALSEHRSLRYLNFIALYLAQGIPEGMIYYGIPAWMAMNSKTPIEIGAFVAAAGLPWSFKIIVAPLMDRFTYLPMGRRRPWVMIGQLGLVVSFIAMAFIYQPLQHLSTFMLAGFVVGFFGAFQDVATDGMAVDIVPVEQQARANGLMWGAKIIGSSLSLYLGSYLLNHYSFSAAVLMLSIGVSIIFFAPMLLRERSGEKFLPWTKGEASPETKNLQLESWREIFHSLFHVFRLRNSLILAFVLFFSQMSFNYISTFLPIFTVQALGWTNEGYSKFFAIASMIGGFGGMLIGGLLIDRFGKLRMLNYYYAALILFTLGFLALQNYWLNPLAIMIFMCLHQLVYVFFCIGIFALSMQFCWKKVSASQFTLFMTIGNLGRIFGARILGEVKTHASWEITLSVFVLLFSVSWIFFRFVRIHVHMDEVANLDKKIGINLN